MGNRANEGQAEMTICVYLPQIKKVLFVFKRAKIKTNNGFGPPKAFLTIPKTFKIEVPKNMSFLFPLSLANC